MFRIAIILIEGKNSSRTYLPCEYFDDDFVSNGEDVVVELVDQIYHSEHSPCDQVLHRQG